MDKDWLLIVENRINGHIDFSQVKGASDPKAEYNRQLLDFLNYTPHPRIEGFYPGRNLTQWFDKNPRQAEDLLTEAWYTVEEETIEEAPVPNINFSFGGGTTPLQIIPLPDIPDMPVMIARNPFMATTSKIRTKTGEREILRYRDSRTGRFTKGPTFR